MTQASPSQLLEMIFSAPPQAKAAAINQLQSQALSLFDPGSPAYQQFLAAAKPYFLADRWEKITGTDPEDADLTSEQKNRLLPGKIIAAVLTLTPPGDARTIRDILEDYRRSQESLHPTPPKISPLTTKDQQLTANPVLKSAHRLASLTTLKTPFSGRLPKITLTPPAD